MNIKITIKPVGATTGRPRETQRIFIYDGKNMVLLLNQEYHGLLIRQPSVATFPDKGRLLVTLC